MKIALYIEDGLEQIVLTPESTTEKGILGKLHDGSRSLNIVKGSFYDCRGGWKRYGQHYQSAMYGGSESNDESTMIVLRPPASAGSPQGRDAVGGSIAEGDNIAVGEADAQTPAEDQLND
jgi:hypothetical protein